MARKSPMRELFEARVEGLRRRRAEDAARFGAAPPVEGDVEEEIQSLADRYGIKRPWVAPPSPRRAHSATPYVVAAVIGIGLLGAGVRILGSGVESTRRR